MNGWQSQLAVVEAFAEPQLSSEGLEMRFREPGFHLGLVPTQEMTPTLSRVIQEAAGVLDRVFFTGEAVETR